MAMAFGAVERTAAGPSILAGAFQLAKLRRNWSSPRPEADRHDLALARCNTGICPILAAQLRCVVSNDANVDDANADARDADSVRDGWNSEPNQTNACNRIRGDRSN